MSLQKAALMPNLAPYTVVYVLLPVVEPSALAKLISRLLSVQAPTEDVVLKIVPPHAFNNDSLSEMALEVYDKITRPLVPISVRGSLIELPVTSLQYPAFTLAPLNEPKVDLSLSWPLRSYDVLNRWRLVHCAYGWNETRDRIVSFVIDSAGEGWSQLEQMVEAGKVDDALEDLYRSFVVFAKRANVEYRLSICAVGGISKGEIDCEYRVWSSWFEIDRDRLDKDWPVFEDTCYLGRRRFVFDSWIERNQGTCHGDAHLRRDLCRLDHPVDRRDLGWNRNRATTPPRPPCRIERPLHPHGISGYQHRSARVRIDVSVSHLVASMSPGTTGQCQRSHLKPVLPTGLPCAHAVRLGRGRRRNEGARACGICEDVLEGAGTDQGQVTRPVCIAACQYAIDDAGRPHVCIGVKTVGVCEKGATSENTGFWARSYRRRI
jgi:hypothetical protein